MGKESENSTGGASHPPLDVVQRWMQAVITHPGGVEQGALSDQAQQQLPISPEQLDRVTPPSSQLSATQRLSIYADAYYSRLLECLGEEFPVLKVTLGEETFGAFAIDYLQRYPSRSYTLAKLGENFPRYLEETRPAEIFDNSGELRGSSSDSSLQGGQARFAHRASQNEPVPGRPLEPIPDWPELLIDLARMEWTFSVVFDGPGTEGQPTLDDRQLSQLDGAALADCRLELAPCVKLLALRFPLNDYYAAARAGESPPLPEASASWLAISRRDYVVRRHPLTERQFQLLSAIAEGHTVGAAIERAAEGLDYNQVETFAAQIGDWFRRWASEGFFVRVL